MQRSFKFIRTTLLQFIIQPTLWHVQVVRQESVKLKPGETTKDPQFVHLHKAQTGAPNHRRARRQPKVCPAVGYLMILGLSMAIRSITCFKLWSDSSSELWGETSWSFLTRQKSVLHRFAMFCPSRCQEFVVPLTASTCWISAWHVTAPGLKKKVEPKPCAPMGSSFAGTTSAAEEFLWFLKGRKAAAWRCSFLVGHPWCESDQI